MTQLSALSRQIWDMKYRLKQADGRPVDKTVEDTWRRVARALAAPESDAAHWEHRFFEALDGFRFLPAGRILAGAGAERNVTLFNCFVMGEIPDDMKGIFENLREAALTMQQGGGIGYDFSTLRPKGAPVRGVGAEASGPLPFMDTWDAMCRTIMSAGSRRGAMMAVLRCDHPDIGAFIDAKRTPGRLRMFNLSVLVTDAFMQAVAADEPWDLIFGGVTFDTLPARELWDHIMRSTYEFAEPGVIFIDRINRLNPLNYCETIHATNPCGEQPLPPYGACLLGSINLARLVERPFEAEAAIDPEALADLVGVAVRAMDNVIDISRFALPAQAHEAKSKRRIGLGITGLADALIMCGARYGSPAAVRLAEAWMKAIQRHAFLASAGLAAEKGAFPLFDREAYLAGETIAGLEPDVREAIARHGVRNALLTSVAPTGTISMFADNVSSGLEPVFSFAYTRSILQPDGSRREEEVSDHAVRRFRRLRGESAPLPDCFVDAMALAPTDHVVMQAAVQKYVESSISKTINCPADISFDAFKDVYRRAYELGCKGCTTYRPNDITGSVLKLKDGPKKPAGKDAVQPELPLGRPARKGARKDQAGAPPPPPRPPEPEPKPRDLGDSTNLVHAFPTLDRPEALPGQTYKLRWPESEHALYITINDIIQDSRRRPFEVFVHSKDTEHYAWTVALTRMISAVFRRGGDVSFVVDELKAVFDPRGGHWMGGKYVPSLLAALGEVIETHMKNIGFLPSPDDEALPAAEAGKRVANRGEAPPRRAGAPFRQCPKCGQASLIRQEGCDTCTSCGYSKCG